ncbi:MAG: DUF5069 domain-containing protein [Nitrospira sp.]|nr:DUF5069 domain-containing protein [Nitrospira sp.]
MSNLEAVRMLAKDLTKTYPRSPRETLGGYVIGARCADKCRAFLLGVNGDYNYWPCSLAGMLFSFTGITPEQFKDVVATGANDEELAAWLKAHSKVQDRTAIIQWNNQMKDLRLSEMPTPVQAYMEDYIAQYVPKHRPVYAYFDVYDLEEKRL